MNPFTTPLITPTEYHNATLTPQSRRIIPLAAYRPTLHASFESYHLPGSKFFPLDQITTPSPYPTMLPTPSHFAAGMSALGIQKSDILVIYDAEEIGTYHAPRLAFMCELFGHRHVHVLNNLRAYVRLGLPVGDGEVVVGDVGRGEGGGEGGGYIVDEGEVDTQRVIEFEEVRDVVLRGREQDGKRARILDARIPGRFRGVQAEMDPALRSGHMPGAVNVPLARLLNEQEGSILSPGELKRVLVDAGALEDGDGKVEYILTCNSGVTAAALDLALRLVGAKGTRRVYDGSWMEWTRRVGDELIEVS
ncbi:sulfurtransferase [Aspergillus ibericus CBS 121593]|uniref:Thiosulfate sulfurtransferase n=1 Tax=Aspergillus ibericus CBS 121593 TaxID=1448316 RepID=A0A395GZP2_9EURO|nr:thiosulfate sulfurtransferase [Aspergillus ibericus CBS 121593]RAL00138.1 thiosulfate sulfurtransferase [Aspergillus ibericus CBS 121593]